MQIEMRILQKLMLAAVAAACALWAQDTKPSCNRCSATYISNEEILAFLNRAPAKIAANDVSDQQVRALDIGKLNVDIGIVYRRALSGVSPVAEHDLVSEVYHVLDGSATLVTGPDIVDAKRRPSTNENVRLLNGPGSNGTSIRNGATYQLKAGDVIVSPAGVGHWFTKIDHHIRYLMVRIDPDKVTPLKDEAAAKADLARDR